MTELLVILDFGWIEASELACFNHYFILSVLQRHWKPSDWYLEYFSLFPPRSYKELLIKKA